MRDIQAHHKQWQIQNDKLSKLHDELKLEKQERIKVINKYNALFLEHNELLQSN